MYPTTRIALLLAASTLTACTIPQNAAPLDPATAIDIEVINESPRYVTIFTTFDVDKDCGEPRVRVQPSYDFVRTNFQIDLRRNVTFLYQYLEGGFPTMRSCKGTYTFPVEKDGSYRVRMVRLEQSCRVEVTKRHPGGEVPVELIKRTEKRISFGRSLCEADDRF